MCLTLYLCICWNYSLQKCCFMGLLLCDWRRCLLKKASPPLFLVLKKSRLLLLDYFDEGFCLLSLEDFHVHDWSVRQIDEVQ